MHVFQGHDRDSAVHVYRFSEIAVSTDSMTLCDCFLNSAYSSTEYLYIYTALPALVHIIYISRYSVSPLY